METHYFNTSDFDSFRYRFIDNQFYSAYVIYLLDKFENNLNEGGFLTSKFTDIQQIDLPIILSLMDLSDENLESHKFKSDGKRGIMITLNSNSIVYKKEIKAGEQ